MKTITVLTDFSERAENAARYALRLAQHLQTNITLYNSFLVPAAEPLGGQVYWSMENFNNLQQDSEEQLKLLAGRLEEELSTLPINAFKPGISCKSQEGPLFRQVNKIAADRDVMLLVMGTHRKGLASLIMGNHMRDIIGSVSLPVLVVPENQFFKHLDKLIFATDMSKSDLEIVHALTELAKPSHADITLAYVQTPGTTEDSTKKLVTNFLEEISNKINYPKIYYRTVKGVPLKEGLKWLTEHVTCDMFVMVHRHKSFLEELLNLSNTQKMAANINLPLLVYPCHEDIAERLITDVELGYQENIIASAIS
ncbi:nucleotide-binding universal stress UspA family protein [Pedobacter cryoconitis]|uniref:Nucleotide-binding universal stress UspA family protein n=1 Tax=Pedobacter cryoconitis TaxID=188932 RepID=A0A7W8ZL95_9SPHI|nr:universal stress protein [Pedobacter cryoconitis]MBB5635895.1 nucleotide-binding universal stress UspA family protein [Pedobacter cryoconitis]